MRKLAIAAFSFSAAVFAANYLFFREYALYAALVFALAGAAVQRIGLKSLKGLVIAVFAAAVGFAVFAAHYDLTVAKAQRLSGETGEMRFVLLETPQKHAGYASAEARIEREGSPRLKCILYDYDGFLDGTRSGDLITAEAKLSSADLRYGVHTTRYNSRDVYLTASIRSPAQISGRRVGFASLASGISDRVTAHIGRVFDAETASFIKALIMGDKSEIYDNDELYVSLSRAGLMHVVAVSGMHVSYLVAFLQLLLGRGKRTAFVCIPLVWAFVAVSGMSPSALRAAIMQTMLLSAPLFEKENDPITSLSFALALLLLFNPFAAANISLQLSFAAMLGIILFAERIEELLMKPFGDGRAAKIARIPVGILSCTFGVMVFSLPITTAYFGYVSLLAPLTNLLCLWAVPFCFIGAFAACALSWVPVIGRLLTLFVSLCVRYFVAVCRFITSLHFSVVYLPGWLNAVWILVFYLSLALVFYFKLKPAARLLIPISAAVLGILVSHSALSFYYSSAKGTITAVDVGQGQCVCVISGEHAVVVDCGSTSYAEYNAGDCAAAYLKSCGIERVDALVLTHLHADHANGCRRLLNLIRVDRIIIPADAELNDSLLWEILFYADYHGTELEFHSGTALRHFGDFRLLILDGSGQGSENERCMPLIASIGDYDLIITGDAPASEEKAIVSGTDLSQIESIVVGHHGSKTSSCEEYLSAVSGERAIISVGKNGYGLPSQEVLERLEAFGYDISRTDLDGNVEIRIDG